MKRVLIAVLLISLCVTLVSCSSSTSIIGEYKMISGTLYSYGDNRLVLTEDGSFNYKTEAVHGVAWIVQESGLWDREGNNLYLIYDDSEGKEIIITATINDGKIIGDTNVAIFNGTWEKVS